MVWIGKKGDMEAGFMEQHEEEKPMKTLRESQPVFPAPC